MVCVNFSSYTDAAAAKSSIHKICATGSDKAPEAEYNKSTKMVLQAIKKVCNNIMLELFSISKIYH